MKYFQLILLFSLFIFTGCSGGSTFGGGSTPIAGETNDDIGDGVQIRLSSIDSSKLVATQSIFFIFTMFNDNVDQIEISRDNIKISTVPGDTSLSTNSIFSQDSIDSFYDTIFRGDSTIYLNDIITVEEGIALTIDPKHASKRPIYEGQDVTMQIKLLYGEKFEQQTNLNVNFQDSDVNNIDTIKKKGPLEITNFELQKTNTKVLLFFDITGDLVTNSDVKIENLEFKFGQDAIICSFRDVESKLLFEPLKLSFNQGMINVICDLDFSLTEQYLDDTDFTFSSNLDYLYEQSVYGSFTMPNQFEE